MRDVRMNTKQIVKRLRHLVALNEPEHGGPFQGTAAALCVLTDELERLVDLLDDLVGEAVDE